MSVSTTHRRPCQHSSTSTCRASCADRPGRNPEADRQEKGLEDRPEHDLHRGLHDPVTNRRNRQRSLLCASRLGDKHPPGRQRTGPAFPQLAGQPGNAVLLDMGQGDLVNARRAIVAAHRGPRGPQNVTAADLVIQRVKPSPGIGLRRPVQRMLQGTDRIGRDTPARSLRGGTSRNGTHQTPPRQTLRTDEAAALPITGGYVVRPAQPVLRPPPTPTRPAIHFPRSSVIGHHAPAATSAGHRAGEGLPSSRRHPRYVPRPIRRGVPHGCACRLCTASMAFTLNSEGSALPVPARRRDLKRRRRLRVMLRTESTLPLCRAFDAGIRWEAQQTVEHEACGDTVGNS